LTVHQRFVSKQYNERRARLLVYGVLGGMAAAPSRLKEVMDGCMIMRMSSLLLGCLVLAGCMAVDQAQFPPQGSFRPQEFDVGAGGSSERVKGAAVSNAFFAGENRPVVGRGVLPSENGSMRVAVISFRFWHDKFRGDFYAVGKTLQVNGQNVTIVGVMRKDFEVPNGAQIWVPSSLR
jgi:hypothetical protein